MIKTNQQLASFSDEDLINEIIYDKNSNYIGLYNLQNPHNLGAVIRSCLGFNIKGIYLIGNCCDLYHPEVIRSSMGYVFKMPVERYNSFDYFLQTVKSHNMKLLAMANNDRAIDIFNYKNRKNNCFIIMLFKCIKQKRSKAKIALTKFLGILRAVYTGKIKNKISLLAIRTQLLKIALNIVFINLIYY